MEKVYTFYANENNSDMKISKQEIIIDSSKINNVILRNNKSVIQFDYEEFTILIFEDDAQLTQLQVYLKSEFYDDPFLCSDPQFFIKEKECAISELINYLLSRAIITNNSGRMRVYYTSNEINALNLRDTSRLPGRPAPPIIDISGDKCQ